MLFLFIPVGAPTVVWAEFPPVTSLYAPQNQAMICGELDRLTPAAFQTELRDCLVDYYEKVCGMAGVGRCNERPEAQIRGQDRRRQ